MNKSADYPADQSTVRRLPADLSKELLLRTGSIRRDLEEPIYRFWDDYILCHGDSKVYIVKELQHNAILERAMDEIDRLNAKIEELELRPPELGGTAFLASKQHWEETISGEQL